ncbi:MAG: S-layer homology domain-containing protein [Syntrophomonas sp.]
MKSGLGYKQRKIPVTGRNIALVFLLLVVFSCCFFSTTALAEEPAKPEQIILTWIGDSSTSQTITWLMQNNSPAQVQYLKEDEFNGIFDTAQTIEANSAEFDSTHYRYTANITGLTPDTTYIYRVGSEGAWSEPLSFSTAAGMDKFSFLYMGDVQSGYTEWSNTLNSVCQDYPQIKFSLLGGDLTDNGEDETEWGQFLDAAAGTFSRLPVMPTMGNHDGFMYLKFFALPDNGPEGFKQEFYSFDYGDAHFVVLNTGRNTDEGVKQWLREDLQNTTKKWKFAVFHIPAYPAATDYKGIDQSICENWIPILEQNSVDMVFVGHQHEYMRTYPIYQGEVQTDPAKYGIVYVMGNAGSKTYAGGGGFPYIAMEQTGNNYQVIDIDGNVLTMTAKKSTGELIESYTINKAPSLTADTVENITGQSVDLTFVDDPDWRGAINEVSVNDVVLQAGQYANDAIGKITINGDVFNTAGEYTIVIKATGYSDSRVMQTILAPVTLNLPAEGQDFLTGQQVTIKGTVQGSLTKLNVKVTNPNGQDVYGPGEIGVADGNFETSFTLSSNAVTGTYTITLEDAGVLLVTRTFRVKAGSGEVKPGDIVLTITGSGVANEVQFTLAELEKMEQYQQVYSAINTWPSKKWYVGKGVKLRDLLNRAGMRGNGLIKFTAEDGFAITLTAKELLDDTRYYFPNLKTGGDGDGHIPGSSAGKQVAEPIVALLSAEGTDDPGDMNDIDALLLMLGQRAVTEQTGQLFVKKLCKIEVLATSPSQWDTPTADPGSGEVAEGTMVKLSNDHMDDDKIHYTTDGTTPNINSPMYNWIASRWWSSRADDLDTINHPIEIKEDTTIKAITIGPGKRDSNVATFTYKVKKAINNTNETISPGKDNTISLGEEVTLMVPANAIKETGVVEIKIEKVTTPPVIPSGYKLAGNVYEFSIGDKSTYSFAKKVSLTISFDPDTLADKEIPAVYFYDEALGEWVNIGGTVNGNTVTVEIDHFTKFAVMAKEELTEEKQETVNLADIEGHWAEQSIKQLVASGVVAGYPDGTFKPDQTMSRAEFVTLLVKALILENDGGKLFADTTAHWAKDYIARAVAAGLINGYDGTTFGPDDLVTREQMAAVICKAGKLPMVTKKPGFTDSNSISVWAQEAIAAVIDNGLMCGYPDNTFRPQGIATRAEAATVMVKVLNKLNAK